MDLEFYQSKKHLLITQEEEVAIMNEVKERLFKLDLKF